MFKKDKRKKRRRSGDDVTVRNLFIQRAKFYAVKLSTDFHVVSVVGFASLAVFLFDELGKNPDFRI